MPINVTSLLSMQAFNNPGPAPSGFDFRSAGLGLGTGLLIGSQISQGIGSYLQSDFNAAMARVARKDTLNLFTIQEEAIRQRDRHFIEAPLAVAGARGIRTTGAPMALSIQNRIDAQRDALNRAYQLRLQLARFKNIENIEKQKGITALASSIFSSIGIAASGAFNAGKL